MSRRTARWIATSVLLVLSAVVGMAAVVGGFARAELLDTDRYVETVAPLARDPIVQQAVADRLTDELVAHLDVAELTQRVVDALQAQGAPATLDGLVGPFNRGVRSFIHTEVRAVLASDTFAQVWEAANRAAHDELDALLTTGRGQFSSIDNATVQLDLGAILAVVKQRLVDAGLTLAKRLPDVAITVPLVASEEIPKIQRWVRLLDAAAVVLPLAAFALLAAAVLTAPDRRRAVLWGAAGFGAGMLVLLAAVAVGRGYYLDHLPDTVHSRAAAGAIYDTLLRFLVAGVQTLTVIAAVVVVACWLVGPGRVASGLRRGAGWLLDRMAAGINRLRLPLGRVPAVAARHQGTVKALLLVVVMAVLVIWRYPAISGTLWLAAGLAAAVGLVELVRRLDPMPPMWTTGARRWTAGPRRPAQ